MLSKQKVYALTQLSIESNSLCFEIDKTNPKSTKTSQDNPSHLTQFSNESKSKEQHLPNHQHYENGRWTTEENQRFIEALFIYGTDWKKVQQYIKTRTSIQSRSHAQKFFITFNKKYKEAYGKEQPEAGANHSQADYMLNILSKMHSCRFITDLCKDSDQFLTEANLAYVQHTFGQKDMPSKLKSMSTSTLKRTIEERRENFMKVLFALMTVSSRTKNHSKGTRAEPVMDYYSDKESKCTIDPLHNRRDFNHNASTGKDGNDADDIQNQSEMKSETNGTGNDCLDNQINNGLSYEEPLHFISFDDFPYVEGQYFHDDFFNVEMPFFFGQGKE